MARQASSTLAEPHYDVRVFELMPLYLKIEVIEKGVVVYARDLGELYEYFYVYHRIWNDQKHRQLLTRDEAIRLFTRSA